MARRFSTQKLREWCEVQGVKFDPFNQGEDYWGIQYDGREIKGDKIVGTGCFASCDGSWGIDDEVSQ